MIESRAVIRLRFTDHRKANRSQVMDRGIPTEEGLAKMRRIGASYLVGTPKGRLSKLEQGFLGQPWAKVRDGVQVMHLATDEEIYVLAQSDARIDKGRGMRRRRLRRYVDRLQALQGQALTRDPLRMKLGAARHQAGRAAHLVKVTIPVHKARMSADPHMAEDMKTSSKANLFIIFGETEIDLINQDDVRVRLKVNRVDVFKPQSDEVVSNGADGIACRCIGTDYNEESFFVRHACFLGANDPYGSLKATLKTEIDVEAWSSPNGDTARLFIKPTSGRIALKVINHLGGEVMKVPRVQ